MHNNIPVALIKLIWIIYLILMVVLLFARSVIGYMINFNIFEIIPASSYAFFQNLLNLFLFIPIGFCIKRRKSLFPVIICVVAFVTLIETIQLLTMRGIFDIVDSILNSVGISIGYTLNTAIPNTFKIL